MPRPLPPLTDRQALDALDMRDNEGMTLEQIGARLGRSKNTIVGLFNRIRADTDATDADGIGNGTMPRRWWAK